MYDVAQIYSIVNDAVEDVLGKTSGVQTLETTGFTSLGDTLSNLGQLDGWFGKLTKRIAQTIYFVRSYSPNTRNVLRDEHEYGAFIQKIYYDLPTAVENDTWLNKPDGDGDYEQANPYGVTTSLAVDSKLFGGKGTWSIEIVRPMIQIKNAFLSEGDMMNFIDGIYMQIENAFKLEEEAVVSMAVNTAMAQCLKSTNTAQKRNLLNEWNTVNPDNELTVAEALKSADFLKWASKEINKVIDNLGIMNTQFNGASYATFTPKDKLVVEMNSEFASCTDMYLQADTFHNELTALPNFIKVPFWQSSGKNSYAFADTSKIEIKHADINGGTKVTQSGIICFVRDEEAVMATFGSRRTWELVNPRAEVITHGEKAEKGFCVDNHANMIVFYIA